MTIRTSRLRVLFQAVALGSTLSPVTALAQATPPATANPPAAAPAKPCVQGPGSGATDGAGSGKNLSDTLAESKGVICPPAGVDNEIAAQPPGGGRMPVIPPPGSPGSDQSIQPK